MIDWIDVFYAVSAILQPYNGWRTLSLTIDLYNLYSIFRTTLSLTLNNLYKLYIERPFYLLYINWYFRHFH